MTPDQPQNFDANPDPESSEDELIRAYISIDRSKSTDPATFAESQNGPNAKQWMEAIKEQIWLTNLFAQLGLTYSKNPIWTDSQSAIALAHNPEHHARTKHIDIQYHFVREALLDKQVDMRYIPTERQIADGLTKPLDPTKFESFLKGLGLASMIF